MGIVLAASTLLAYQEVLGHDFTFYDDDEYVTENYHVSRGLRWDSVVWAFTHFHSNNWHPLTWLSHMLDCELFGLEPAGHHATSLLLHVCNALLVLAVMGRYTARLWPSAAVAMLFALHPLRVESVAWVSERKDLLCGLFWLLTLLAYDRYGRRPSAGRYGLVVVGFCLALMAKPMAITLPFVFLLLDYWPLRRLTFEPRARLATARRLVLEKLPLFALCLASALVTVASQSSGGAMAEGLALGDRIANSLVAYVSYLGSMLWPADLAVLYPHRGADLPLWKPVGAAVLLLAITAAALRFGARGGRGYLPVGWLWYLGTLVPVIGLVQVGSQSMADRYTYLPSIGILWIAALGWAEVAARLRVPALVTALMVAILCAACAFATRQQARHWKDDLALCERALAVTDDNWVMHSNYGATLLELGRVDEAVAQFRLVLRAQPDHADANNNLGTVLLDRGELQRAEERFRRAVARDPRHARAHANLAKTYALREQHARAVPHYLASLEVEPFEAPVHANLGVSLRQVGRIEEAIAAYREALRIDPSLAPVHHNLGNLLLERGEPSRAAEHFREALRIDPTLEMARQRLDEAERAADKQPPR